MINGPNKMVNENEEIQKLKDNLVFVKLHENKKYLNDCVDLLNSWWPRSQAARLHNLERSNDKYPCNWILLDSRNSKLVGHCYVDLGNDHLLKGPKPKTAHVYSFIIDKAYRKKGLGHYMMNELEKELIKEGFKRISLTTSNQKSFYESLGFKLQGQNKPLSFNRNVSNTNIQRSSSNLSTSEKLKDASLNQNDKLVNQKLPPPPPPMPAIKNQTDDELVYCLDKDI